MTDHITLEQLNFMVKRLPDPNTYQDKYIRMPVPELVKLRQMTSNFCPPAGEMIKVIYIYFERRTFAEDSARKTVWVMKSPQQLILK